MAVLYHATYRHKEDPHELEDARMAPWTGSSLQEGVLMMAGAGAPSAAFLMTWSLALYGAVLIVTGSRIAEPLRRRGKALSPLLGYFLGCPMCMGFWVAAALSLLGLSLVIRCDDALSPFVRVVLDGCAGSATCWSTHVVLARLGAEDL